MPPGRADTSRFWEQVLQVVDEGRVIPVIGPDLLLLSQGDPPVLLYPLLAERLAQYLELDGEFQTGQSLNSVACRYLAQGNDPQEIYSALKAVMPPDAELAIPEPLIKLARIGSLKTFVSITFDSLLERAINQVRFGGQRKTRVLSYAPNRTDDLDAGTADRPVVFHLFGKLSAVPDYAVTEEDTLEFVHSLQNETKRPQRLFDELNRAHLFILGCSITEWLARFFLRISRRERLLLARGKTDIVADSAVRDDASLVLFLQQFKTGTKIFPGGGALEFVDELYQRWTDRHPKQEPAIVSTQTEPSADEPGMEEGAVFLSYASEDAFHVQRIKEDLERAGVDVWFDKADLSAGDEYELKIKRNIERCSLFVPVISGHCLTPKRRFFRIEWNHAQSVALQVPPSMQFILPVVVDDTSPDEPFLPDRWSRLHWHRAREGQTSTEFVETVRKLYRDYQRSALARSS